jgi:hypothetical protein
MSAVLRSALLHIMRHVDYLDKFLKRTRPTRPRAWALPTGCPAKKIVHAAGKSGRNPENYLWRATGMRRAAGAP